MPLTLKELTPGERLTIERRRKKENQREACARYEVSRRVYGNWELDRPRAADPTIPPVDLGTLMDHEACFLMRRRGDWAQETIANELGVSRVWLAQMELGNEPCAQLVEYWRNFLATSDV